jgi:hypothetical protein
METNQISSFRYHEFLDGLCITGIIEVMKRVDVITINDEEDNFLENILW